LPGHLFIYVALLRRRLFRVQGGTADTRIHGIPLNSEQPDGPVTLPLVDQARLARRPGLELRVKLVRVQGGMADTVTLPVVDISPPRQAAEARAGDL
jgi:hypothetical protein